MSSLLRDFRVLLLFASIFLAVLFISPAISTDGVIVSFVEHGSSAWDTGLDKETIIFTVNSEPVSDLVLFYSAVDSSPYGSLVSLETDKGLISVLKSNETSFGIEVKERPSSKVRLGIDLVGGTRVILKPVTSSGNVSLNETEKIREVLTARMNTYGLSDVSMKSVQDYSGGWYLQVELAGAGSERIMGVIKHVGQFDVRIVNNTVFSGDSIVAVGSPSFQPGGGIGVPFTVKKDSALRLTEEYKKAALAGERTCSHDDDCLSGYTCTELSVCRPLIEMVLDGATEFAAPAAASLHKNWIAGVPEQEMIVSTGSPEEAKRIEAVMRSGSLPAGIERIDVISRDFVDPVLGRDFIRGAIMAGLAALAAVFLVILLRYRNLKIAASIALTSFSEIIILIGAAALFHQDLNLPAIAGIIATMGTGVDQQVIITDELMAGRERKLSSIKQLKRAFSIVVITASTSMATMLPLMTLGIGIVKGFAIMTFLGVLFGVTVTRPAYARIARVILK